MATLVSLGNTVDSAALDRKEKELFSILEGLGRVMVAYSGGADSAYLAWAAHHVLGDNAIAITADSASIPESHKRDAEALARQCG
ncbi:MAG: TIGR00268 family protein, partial [Acidobacteria bacterium]|nr:TIGR00268 family protein [Acidobacteriota bacterium]